MRLTDIHTDKQILLQVAHGDQKAFTTLFNQWAEWLSGYIFTLTESTQTAEEVLQDVFMNIWKNRETLTQIENFKGFLLIVTRNQAYMALRRKMSEERRLQRYRNESIHEEADTVPANLYFSALDEAIDNLPDRAKEVYLLSRQNRLTYQQIADHLGVSKETVKTHLERATTQITTYLKTKFPELTLVTIIAMKNFF